MKLDDDEDDFQLIIKQNSRQLAGLNVIYVLYLSPLTYLSFVLISNYLLFPAVHATRRSHVAWTPRIRDPKNSMYSVCCMIANRGIRIHGRKISMRI